MGTMKILMNRTMHVSCQLGAPKYKRLIGIQAKKHRGNLKESLKKDLGEVGRLSLNEPALEKASISSGNNLVRFTK
ncbi:phosphoinositide phospholipase C [Ranunculus cassubicifolius]